MIKPEKHQDEILEQEDWRFFAIGKLNSGLAMICTTEKYDRKNISFGLPSSVAIFLNLACKARSEVKKINPMKYFTVCESSQALCTAEHSQLFDFFELMITQIIFSYTAIETFSNTMINQKAPENYIYTRIEKSKRTSFSKNTIEKNLNLKTKLKEILPELLSINSPHKGKIWNDLNHLEKLRNRLIHLKSIDMKSSGPEVKTIWGELINNSHINFPKQAHFLLQHYLSSSHQPRWLKESNCDT
jgi:hypothetical protein